MSRVLVGPHNPEYPAGRYFYHDAVGFGKAYVIPVGFNSQGDLTVEFSDLGQRIEVPPKIGNKLWDVADFEDDQLAAGAVVKAIYQAGILRPHGNSENGNADY